MTPAQQEIPRTGLKYQPQLSGLRFCAVLFVVIYHFSNALTHLKYFYDLGVFIVFFFVLSSYLITRILLGAKRKARLSGFGRWKVALAFLARRTLRIFPAYYFYLFILLMLPLEAHEVRLHPAMFFGYLSNVLLYLSKTWGPFTVHLWTLAVEEQFYLVWPWIILFIPDKYLTRVFVAMIIGGILFRVISISNMSEQNINNEIFPMLVLAPACMDCFAAGAILGYCHFRGYTNNRWLKWVLIGIIPIWIFLILSHHRRIFMGMDRVFVSLFAVTIIDIANRGYTGITKRFLENSIVQYLSKISYSIYLYHLIVTVFFWKLFAAAQHHFSGSDLSFISRIGESPYGAFFIYILLAIGCASISWFCLEQPINHVKKLIGYVWPKKKKQTGTAGRLTG